MCTGINYLIIQVTEPRFRKEREFKSSGQEAESAEH